MVTLREISKLYSSNELFIVDSLGIDAVGDKLNLVPFKLLVLL